MVTYEPTNILVTGGAGFIGSHVSEAVLREFAPCNVVVLDKLDVCSSVDNVRATRFVQGDIRDATLVRKILADESIDTVVHFAAHTHVDASFGNSLDFTINNTYGTHVLLEACREHGKIRRFVNVSTDEVYGETFDEADELATLEPTNPYAAAKAGAELMARAYFTSYGLPVITTRGNNVYGPRQYPEKVVPKFISRGSAGLPLEVHGDGGALRSFVHVRDVADAFCIVIRHGRVGDVYNIGSAHAELTVLQVARRIAREFPGVKIRHVRDRHFNDRRYLICDKKLAELGWVPKISFDEGLRDTISWYAANPGYWGADVPLDAHPE